MKIKDGFLLRKLGQEYTAVALGSARKDFNGLIRMNDTGKFLWECLQRDCQEEELIRCLREEYQVSEEEEAAADIRGFVERLKGAGILA